MPPAIIGARPGKTVRDNISPHCNKPYILCLDFQNFFPSIRHERVYSLFTHLDCAPQVARILTRLTTADYHVPLGFNTSTYITNLLLVPLAKKLDEIADHHGLNVTIWVDDITISGGEHLVGLEEHIRTTVRAHGFLLHPTKGGLFPASDRQEVTGYVVNRGCSVPPETREEVNWLLEQLSNNGQEYYGEVMWEKTRQKLYGRIQQMRLINPQQAEKYKQKFHQVFKE